jgi:hypothetical protein
MKKYWVVHREQVTGELNVSSYEEKLTADLKQRQLRSEYYDAVVLQQEDINELYLQASIESKKKMLEYEKNKNI